MRQPAALSPGSGIAWEAPATCMRVRLRREGKVGAREDRRNGAHKGEQTPKTCNGVLHELSLSQNDRNAKIFSLIVREYVILIMTCSWT
jgi:hypothetical protein